MLQLLLPYNHPFYIKEKSHTFLHDLILHIYFHFKLVIFDASENFVELKDHLICLGFTVVVIGGTEEANLAKKLESEDVIVLNGRLSVMQSALVLKKAVLTISNDSGPMHLSYAVGTPVVAIFSCRDYPIKWYPPIWNKNYVFRADKIDCECCFVETCLYDNRCINAIGVEAVFGKVVEILKKPEGNAA